MWCLVTRQHVQPNKLDPGGTYTSLLNVSMCACVEKYHTSNLAQTFTCFVIKSCM